MICFKCTKTIRNSDEYCPYCGVKTVELVQLWEEKPRACKKCSTVFTHDHNYCFNCGSSSPFS